MLKIAVCDDQTEVFPGIQEILGRWRQSSRDLSTAYFSDGDALIAAHRAAPFDIILLDVVMPLINGIETAAEIRAFDRDVKIVFLTSSAEFAVDSYRVKANDYLLKPVDAGALCRCLDELSAALQSSQRSIAVKCPEVTRRIALEEIEYIEAQNKHTLFALVGGKTVEAIELMNVYEHKLPAAGFFKCHRSYIVNLHQVDCYTSKELRTRSGRSVPIARSCQKEFEDAYFTALFGKAGDGAC